MKTVRLVLAIILLMLGTAIFIKGNVLLAIFDFILAAGNFIMVFNEE